MSDFFNTSTSLENSNLHVRETAASIYGHLDSTIDNRCFIGINLGWPNFVLPENYDRYFVSFHTEYLDVSWIIDQAKKVYPKPVMMASDFQINPGDPWPDNIIFVQCITIHKQLETGKSRFGLRQHSTFPKYKISSLSNRVSQYKRYVTAYLLKTFPQDCMILSYHDWLAKDSDMHDHTPGIPYLDQLQLEKLTKTRINFEESNSQVNISPIDNANWNIAPFNNALFNLTNESFHYSSSVYDDQTEFEYPGPYLTDKTLKVLLGGRPFIAVGQAGTLEFLNKLGLKTTFGLDTSYDAESGDLVRIKMIFDQIDYINNTDLDILYKNSISDVEHNLHHIKSKNMYDICENKNITSYKEIKNFLIGD